MARYNAEQIIRIILLSDLLENPLDAVEREAAAHALDNAGGNTQDALGLLDPESAQKAAELLEQGLAASIGLDKLQQRGIDVIFPDDSPFPQLAELLQGDPQLLFASGSSQIDHQGLMPVFYSLGDFKMAGCSGVLVADRMIETLLKDRQVAESVRKGRACLVSDSLRQPVNRHRQPCKSTSRTQVERQARNGGNVFISGSRSQMLIPQPVQDSLDAVIKQGLHVLIGDSNKGVDREVIDFLRAPLYEHVTVFTIAAKPRVKPESAWSVRHVEADDDLNPRERQTAKDRVMADEAQWGLALFNPIEKNRYGSLQVSSGTLRNTVQMLLQGKMVKLFYAYEGKVLSKNLRNLDELAAVIEGYRQENLTSAEREGILSSRGVPGDADPAFVKSRKIMAKYESLLKEEKRIAAEWKGTGGKPAQAELPFT